MKVKDINVDFKAATTSGDAKNALVNIHQVVRRKVTDFSVLQAIVSQQKCIYNTNDVVKDIIASAYADVVNIIPIDKWDDVDQIQVIR